MNVHLSSCPVILSNCVVLHVKVWYFMLLSCIDTVETTLSDWCDIGMILHGPELHCTDNIYRSDPEWLACHWCCAEWNLRVGSIIAHSSVNRFWRSLSAQKNVTDWGLRGQFQSKIYILIFSWREASLTNIRYAAAPIPCQYRQSLTKR